MWATESAGIKTLISLQKYSNPSQDMWPHFLFLSVVLWLVSVDPYHKPEK